MSIFQIAVLMTLANAVFWTVLNFGVGFATRILPSGLFDSRLPFYRERKFEKRFYRWIGVARWKDRLPEAGGMVGFQKRALSENITPEYVGKFIRETCIAELGHLLAGILGFTSVFFCLLVPNKWGSVWVFLIFAVLNLFIQMLFVIIQRYNRPKLERLKTYLERKNPL